MSFWKNAGAFPALILKNRAGERIIWVCPQNRKSRGAGTKTKEKGLPLRGKLQARRGFTLIELMVALAIMLILATLAGAGLTAYARRSRFARNEANARTVCQLRSWRWPAWRRPTGWTPGWPGRPMRP